MLLAALTAATVHGALGRAALAESRWSSTRTVLVATRPIRLGEPLDGAVTRRTLPATAVPTGALASVPEGRLATAMIGAGEVVTRFRVSGEQPAGVAAALPPGTEAVVVPLQVAGLPAQPGDRVDLLASASGDDSPSGTSSPATGADGLVAHAALVVADHGTTLVVAVSPEDAVRIAAAMGKGALVPALDGPG